MAGDGGGTIPYYDLLLIIPFKTDKSLAKTNSTYHFDAYVPIERRGSLEAISKACWLKSGVTQCCM